MKSFRFLPLVCSALLVWLAAPPLAEAKPTIIIDAGHGGHDRGGVPGQRTVEKYITLQVAQRVASKLRSAGYPVKMTRTGDYFVGLGGRVAAANSTRNAVFLSVHMNSAPRLSATGVETYYYNSRSGAFASALHREILRVMGTENRGIRRRGFYVIRNARCPAVLIEPGFLTNAGEARRLASSSFQDTLASALVRAVVATFR